MTRPFKRRGYRVRRIRELWRRQVSTSEVGNNNADTAWPPQARVDGRFEKNNPWRWRPGQSGNPSGRPPRPDDDYNRHVLTLLDLIGRVRALEWGHVRQRDERFEKFKVLYGITGNAFLSARLAGYSPKTAKSKAYLLARRATDAE
jgi:hypothetical protein